ncbi:MAG: protease modulator HflC [Comamonas sp.]
MNRIGFVIASVLLALLVLSSTVFVVDQRQFGVVYTLGEIRKVITQPGLHFKLPPPFQNVTTMDKRLLMLDSVDAEPMLTAEKQRVVIDWYVRWRITDPQQYIRNVGVTEAAGANQLSRIIRDSFQEQINKRTVRELLSTQRESLMADVKKEITERVSTGSAWGVDIADVRITRVDYVEAITDAVYRRMQAERVRVANELRSTGAAEGEKIRADADRQRDVVVAQAYRDAQGIKGEGDAQASQAYAAAFGKDPQFAAFYRSLDAYRQSFASKNDVVVIDGSSDFFRAMRTPAAAGSR